MSVLHIFARNIAVFNLKAKMFRLSMRKAVLKIPYLCRSATQLPSIGRCLWFRREGLISRYPGITRPTMRIKRPTMGITRPKVRTKRLDAPLVGLVMPAFTIKYRYHQFRLRQCLDWG